MPSFRRLGPTGAEIPALRVAGRDLDLRPLTSDIDGDFLARGGVGLATRAAHLGQLEEIADSENLRVGAPIATPGKIVCIGLNFHDHARETGAAIPDEPIVFFKDPTTVVGPFDEVLVPRRSVKTDWEVELGVVIGATARYLDSPADAPGCIAGYVLSHDVSEREFQLERGGQWDKGKSCETFNPLGPDLVPSISIGNPQSLGMRLWVNGVQKQNGSTADMVFDVNYLVWYLSQFMVLRPGDLVNTGTPAGVALGEATPTYLRAGDVVELEIDELGRARQRVGQA